MLSGVKRTLATCTRSVPARVWVTSVGFSVDECEVVSLAGHEAHLGHLVPLSLCTPVLVGVWTCVGSGFVLDACLSAVPSHPDPCICYLPMSLPIAQVTPSPGGSCWMLICPSAFNTMARSSFCFTAHRGGVEGSVNRLRSPVVDFSMHITVAAVIHCMGPYYPSLWTRGKERAQ